MYGARGRERADSLTKSLPTTTPTVDQITLAMEKVTPTAVQIILTEPVRVMAMVHTEAREMVMVMYMAIATFRASVPGTDEPGAAIVPVRVELLSIFHRTVSGTTRAPDTKRVLARAPVMLPALATVLRLMVPALTLVPGPTGMATMAATLKVVTSTPPAMPAGLKAMAPTVQLMVVVISLVLITVTATERALALATQNMLLRMVILKKLLKDA